MNPPIPPPTSAGRTLIRVNSCSQLVAAGEMVLNVPATWASRVRMLGTGQSAKSDLNDARSGRFAAVVRRRLVPIFGAPPSPFRCPVFGEHVGAFGACHDAVAAKSVRGTGGASVCVAAQTVEVADGDAASGGRDEPLLAHRCQRAHE